MRHLTRGVGANELPEQPGVTDTDACVTKGPTRPQGPCTSVLSQQDASESARDAPASEPPQLVQLPARRGDQEGVIANHDE